MKLFAYPTVRELEASLPRFWIERGFTHRSPGLVRALAEFEFGDQSPRSLAAARAWLHARQDWPGCDVFDVILARLSPRIAVEKSPENVANEAALGRLAAAYSRARYLHLTRDPITTQRSIREHWRRTFSANLPDDDPMAGIAVWVETNLRIMRFAATLPADRCIRIRAEDVLNGTWPQLRAIAEWLGVDSGADAIEAMMHPESSRFAGFGPEGSGVIGGNDPGFLRDPVPRRVERPRKLVPPSGWRAEPALWQMTLELANHFGYFTE